MRWKGRPDLMVRMEAKRQWHRYFAWFPVRVEEDVMCWLIFVERKGEFQPGSSIFLSHWDYKYRDYLNRL